MQKNELYEVINKKGELRIILTNKLSCKLWGEHWGIISEYFGTKDFLFDCSSVKLDFSQCYWADPIALLSILLQLMQIKYEYKKYVKILLPRLGVNNNNNINFYKGQFLKFLATQGYMKIMIDNFYVYDNKEKLTNSKIVKYASYNYRLVYDEAEIVLAKIYDLGKYNSEKIMSQIEEEILYRLKNTVSLQTYYILETQIYNIISELIENVDKHAYRPGRQKWFGLYIRKRYGAVKNYGKETAQYSEIANREKNNCPALDNQVALDSEAFLESFFVDIGMGMKGSLQEYYKSEIKRKYKYPIRELFYKVLKEGLRKNDSASLTPYGGLHFICRILKESNGYIWCNEGKEWVGSHSSDLLTKNNETTKAALTDNKDNAQNKGLSWCFRIPYSDIIKCKNTIAYAWEDQINQHPVFKVFQTIDRSLNVNRTVCVDDRYNKCILMNGEPREWEENLRSVLENKVSLCGRADSYVWFPKDYYSKNAIISRLKEIVGDIIVKIAPALEDISIVIGEIDSNELISFYYALNNISLNVLGTFNIVKVLLVTKTWEVVCLCKKDNCLYINRDISRKYNAYNSNNSAKLHDCIGEYAKFIRKYDSYLFWKYIKQNQNEKIFINADISWNSQITIKGYLDFERLYLYAELYELLKNSLKRTSGFVPNSEVEYKSIDFASARICQDINANNIYSDLKETSIINVGGACASGYTRESYYKENRVDINIIFFAHECFDKVIKDTAFLFVWPSRDFFSDFIQEERRYYRLGKTNLITPNSNEMLIDVKNVYKNAVRNKRETYTDFQQKYPRFIKYGHYRTDRHHYLIGFDLVTYIKYSSIKKEGAFVFILWKIVNYLSNGDNEIYESLNDVEWKKVLKNYRGKEDIGHGELVVYHSNTFTEYIFKLVREILPDFLMERIIPINIIEIQPKGAPVTFSPFTFELLREYFRNDNVQGILYIDSSFSTGRKMIEIENILLSSGCQRVSFLSVFDMRRLRNEDLKNYSYWKVNVPRLDDGSQCIFCSTLRLIENFCNSVDSKMNARIQEWIYNWKCLSIVNTINGHGIENISGFQYNVDGISIYDSNSLNIFAAEKICESYSNDYVYKFISGKTDLSIYLKLQLICTQICLYGNQSSRQLQLSLLSELVGNMAKSNIVNSYTSLAGLVLVSQSDMLIYELLNEILYENKKAKILSIKKYLLNSENIDLVIAFTYFVKNSYMVDQLLNGYEKTYPGNYKLMPLINSHLLPEKDLKLLSKEFEGLLINEQGHRHNTNIQKLILEHVTDVQAFKERCQNVRNDLQRLYELSKHFPVALASSREIQDNIRRDIGVDIEKVKLLMIYDEERYEKEEKEGRKSNQIIISEELKEALLKCKSGFESILEEYFITYSDKTIEYFKKAVIECERKYSKKIKLNVVNGVLQKDFHKWYYWNRGIESEFKYFIENLEHCTRPVINGGEIYMDIDIQFEFNQIMIRFLSWSEKIADLVKNEFMSKNRLSKEQALAFDVIFDFDDKERSENGEFLLETKMSIPACYQQLKGE